MPQEIKHHIENARALRFAANRASSSIARTMFYMIAINEIRKARICAQKMVLH